MAKSDRVIKRGVRLGGKTYTEGMEDELGEVLSAEEATRLTEKGYLEGSWKGGKTAPAKAEPAKK
jgi:hypothetical protein